jgi:hypothetical protein
MTSHQRIKILRRFISDRIFLERLQKATWLDNDQVARLINIESNLNNFTQEAA